MTHRRVVATRCLQRSVQTLRRSKGDAAADRVPDWCYGAVCDRWLADPVNQTFLSDRNPWVLRDMSERLLEASNRGLWTGANENQLALLKELINSSEARIERGALTC